MTNPRKFASEAERLIRTGAGCLYPGAPLNGVAPTFAAPVGVAPVVIVDMDPDTAALEREAFSPE